MYVSVIVFQQLRELRLSSLPKPDHRVEDQWKILLIALFNARRKSLTWSLYIQSRLPQQFLGR